MTWGIWAMAVNDGLEYLAGEQPSAVHMGTWYAGDLLDVSDWPVSRTAEVLPVWQCSTCGKARPLKVVPRSNFAWTESSRADGSA
jgi:hypothetical protein